jgi:hypothetical protein
MFLDDEAIQLMKEKASQVFGVSPESIQVSITEREVEVPDYFRGISERKNAQIITFTISAPHLTWRSISFDVVVANASRLGRSWYHCMPDAYELVERLKNPVGFALKLSRIIIDGWLITMEFRTPLSRHEFAQAINALASGFMTDDDGIAFGENLRWVAVRYRSYKSGPW